MSSQSPPPSYRDLYPDRREVPAFLLDTFKMPAPSDATYFERWRDWAEGAGYYRGNPSSPTYSPQICLPRKECYFISIIA